MDTIMSVKTVAIEKLPDVTNKIYVVPKEIFNEYGEVEKTVYEEWIFTAEKIGEVDCDELTEYDEWREIKERSKE